MQDYWNDPPDSPEPPECCGECMEVEEDGGLWCMTCGKRVAAQPDIEPVPEPAGEDWEEYANAAAATPDRCPHGNEWHQCDACMHASDIAYDAARERGR